MKKEYGTPKAEKMEFNYSEAVVASEGIKCKNVTPYTQYNSTPDTPCKDVPDGPTVYSDVMPG